MSILSVAVLGFIIPSAGAYGNAQFNNSVGDAPVLQAVAGAAYSASNNSWSTNVSTNSSNEVSFMIFYHNTSVNSALNTRVELNLPSNVSNGTTVTATITSDNAAAVEGSATVYTNYNNYGTSPLTYVSGATTWYDEGSSSPTPWAFGQNGDQIVSGNGGVLLGNIPAGDVGYVIAHATVGNSGYYSNNGVGASASTGSAVNITNTSATLVGSVYPNGYTTTAWFEYGYTSSLGSDTPSQQVGLTTDTNLSAVVSNLLPATTYYYRIVAQNDEGTDYGTVQTFVTPNYYTSYYTPTYNTPTYAYNYATPINYVTSAVSAGSTSATVSGSAYPNGADSIAWFEYGPTASFGYTTPTQDVGSGYSNVNVSAVLSNLAPATTYYYRIDVQNAYGTSYGGTRSLTSSGSSVNTSVTSNTGTTLTSILTSMNKILLSMKNTNASQGSQSSVALASAPATSSITVSGTALPNGADTSVYFEYGPTTSFGYTTAAQDVGSGSVTVPVSATLTNLAPNTTYYYRVVATNAYGTGYGATRSVTTSGGTATASSSAPSSNSYTASIFSALGGSWTIIGLIILVLIGIGVVVFLRFVLK
jgi:hypothetical protein